ncbi:MAG: hypothetical protein WCL16_09025 [bacterium]
MATLSGLIKPRSYRMPRTRDPIVNTPLLSLGVNAQGVESFWISTYNRCVGCTGLRVDEWGECRTYAFPWQHEGFYSSVHVGGDVLWLCGRLDRVVTLNLKSGQFTSYDTGAPKSRVFEGMIYDPPTGKLLAVNHPHAVSFDIRARKTVKVHAIPTPEGISRFSFRNGDGSYSMVVQIPGEALLRWDPREETIAATPLSEKAVWTQDGMEKRTCRLISDQHGRWYFPGYGWYNPGRREFEQDGPRPEREMAWLFRDGDRVIGALNEGSNLSVHAWHCASGRVEYLLTLPICDIFNVNLTRSRRLVAVTGDGIFLRYDLETLALEATRRLPTASIGDAMAVCRIGRERLIGAPYISSRFWELNLKTGHGTDCGRAQEGWGQIDFIAKVGAKVYMGAYAGGELLEYDPRRPPCFPDNPRLVADPPRGMRPMACTSDGRNLYYASTSDYGTLGSTVTRYDTVTGRAHYAVNPLPDLSIRSLVYDPKGKSLICGSTFHADSMGCAPATQTCQVARLDAATLAVREVAAAPAGTVLVAVCGPLDAGRWLCTLHAYPAGPPTHWLALAADGFAEFHNQGRHDFPPDFRGSIVYAGRPGRFLLNIDDRIEVWDMRRGKSLRTVFRRFDPARFDGYLFSVQEQSLIVLRQKTLLLVTDCLKGI